MRIIAEHGKGLLRNLRCAAAMGALILTGMLSGCAAPTSYMGIDIGNSASAVALSPEQEAFFQEQNLLFARAQAAGCIVSAADEKQAAQRDADQQRACHVIAEQLADLEHRRPELVLTRNYSDMPLPQLASEAQGGSKEAQLELGIRFEEGRGVERDLGKAKKLYAKAASDSGGPIWVYSPAVGNGTKGRVIAVNSGPKRSGLVEAKRRLEGVE